MKAVVRLSDEPHDFTLQDVAEPAPAPGMVKIKVAYTGVCGSDLHIYEGFEKGLPQGVHGHEFSGTVAALGEGVSGFAVGERVTVEHTQSTCGTCVYCTTGRYHLCNGRHSLGFDEQGAFTEYVNVYPQYIHRLPTGVSLAAGALTEPLACIVHGVEKAGVTPATDVLVVGPGAMGLLCGLVLQAYGCGVDIIGAPEDAARLEIAKQCGFSVVTAEDAAKKGYDVAADCSGSEGGVAACIAALSKGGTLLQVGIATRPITLPYDQLVYKELRIQGTFCHTWPDWEQALRLQGKGLLDLSRIITTKTPLEGWKAAFDNLLDKKGIKTLFEIGGEA